MTHSSTDLVKKKNSLIYILKHGTKDIYILLFPILFFLQKQNTTNATFGNLRAILACFIEGLFLLLNGVWAPSSYDNVTSLWQGHCSTKSRTLAELQHLRLNSWQVEWRRSQSTYFYLLDKAWEIVVSCIHTQIPNFIFHSTISHSGFQQLFRYFCGYPEIVQFFMAKLKQTKLLLFLPFWK